MEPFSFVKATDSQAAIRAVADEKNAKFLAGSTNLVDLMRRDVEKPNRLVDINGVGLKKIEILAGGNIRIGALVTNTELAYQREIMQRYPVLSQAILSGASPQIRNRATVGGNILQRTRCPYFYDTVFPCNKREAGSGCSAINGYNRMHAILGTSEQCIAAHPSDMCVAMTALDVIVHVMGKAGNRAIPFSQFHLVPGNTPDKENVLQRDELITSVEIPQLPFAKRSSYLKVRDRASFEFALTSAAVAMDLEGGTIKDIRIAMGGVGTKPWRAEKAEQILKGATFNQKSIEEAAAAEMKDAKALKYNGFKVELAKRTMVSALKTTGGML